MMKRRSFICRMAAALLMALQVFSCTRPEAEADPAELSVSIYIPDLVATKAETGSVGASVVPNKKARGCHFSPRLVL